MEYDKSPSIKHRRGLSVDESLITAYHKEVEENPWDKLSGLCKLSVHRKRVEDIEFINKVMKKFGQQAKRMQFLFKRKFIFFRASTPPCALLSASTND